MAANQLYGERFHEDGLGRKSFGLAAHVSSRRGVQPSLPHRGLRRMERGTHSSSCGSERVVRLAQSSGPGRHGAQVRARMEGELSVERDDRKFEEQWELFKQLIFRSYDYVYANPAQGPVVDRLVEDVSNRFSTEPNFAV